jgi:hypothetical protein
VKQINIVITEMVAPTLTVKSLIFAVGGGD